ncbi:helix-turn-helix transcriptional regulator [Salinimonas marina]|uniref:Helix-turn-helix transcriptional regulator n=2 Tax=Salinimonas marina TaxID=2785918 RepID=A0A7S9E0C3_9ALTE|nr:helix-turn-helix transcriptional regulator [Salinimonas marina]
MKINSKLVVELRKQKAWSQQQLSIVSGVSLRTIQRVENEGNASLETVKSLASAFETEIQSITQQPAKVKTFRGSALATMAFFTTIIFGVLATSSTTAATGIEIQSDAVRQSHDKTETKFEGGVSVFIPASMAFEISTIEKSEVLADEPYQLRLVSENMKLAILDARIINTDEGIMIIANEAKFSSGSHHKSG